MCINTHCTPFKITKYYTTIKVKARVQPLKKLKSLISFKPIIILLFPGFRYHLPG